jgi:hypothetical protein
MSCFSQGPTSRTNFLNIVHFVREKINEQRKIEMCGQPAIHVLFRVETDRLTNTFSNKGESFSII